jgi:four helix bundle protein
MGEKSKIQHFTDFQVWQKSHHLFLSLLNDIEVFPHRRGADIIADQILRSSGSISANIAEGFNRSTKKFLNCLDIALGETNETENWLYKVRDARFLEAVSCEQRIEATNEIGRMINGLIRSLNAKHSDG